MTSAYKDCRCCGAAITFFAGMDPEEAPDRCSMCELRNGQCLHNLYERIQRGDRFWHSSSLGMNLPELLEEEMTG